MSSDDEESLSTCESSNGKDVDVEVESEQLLCTTDDHPLDHTDHSLPPPWLRYLPNYSEVATNKPALLKKPERKEGDHTFDKPVSTERKISCNKYSDALILPTSRRGKRSREEVEIEEYSEAVIPPSLFGREQDDEDPAIQTTAKFVSAKRSKRDANVMEATALLSFSKV